VTRETDSPPRKVWVLMFDRLQFENAGQGISKRSADIASAATNNSDFSPFHDLDLQSTFFEQYLLQDARESALASRIHGTLTAWVRLTARLGKVNKSAGFVRLVGVSERVDDVRSTPWTDSFPASPITSGPLIERTLHCSDEEMDGGDNLVFRNDAELQFALGADLVWIDARTEAADDIEVACSRILKFVQQLRSEASSTPSDSPVLIVSSMHGDSHEVSAPFISGLSESQIHVPLWIDSGGGHACRIQALTGSDDLLPTLFEFLTGTAALAEDEVSVRENLSSLAVPLSSRPMSLVSACEHHSPLPDRLLQLQGDLWDALRTQQYLLVRSRLNESPYDSAGYDSAGPSADEEIKTTRRLYLKPDDAWNVNDAIVSYAAIADQMERMAEETR